MAGMVLIDLQKAFVTIDHDILLKQVSITGFTNHAIDWLQTYLSNQLFRVSLEIIYPNFQALHVGHHGDQFLDVYCLLYTSMRCFKQ